MEDGAICAREVSGTLREGVGRIVNRVFGTSALLLCSPLGADAWLLLLCFRQWYYSFDSPSENVAADYDR